MAAARGDKPTLSPIKKNKKGQVVHRNQKVIIINLYKELKEDDPQISYIDKISKLAKQTGIGKSSVKKILAEYDRTGEVHEPILKKRRLSLKEKINDFDKSGIRRKVHEFYRTDQLATVDKILQSVNDDKDLPQFKRSTFHTLLHELDFVFTKRQQNSIITEKEELIIWRRNYLRAVRRYRVEGRSIYYLDETFVDLDDALGKTWTNTKVKTHRDAFLRYLSMRPGNLNGKGKGLIVLHIGSVAGFLPGGLQCLESQKNTTDVMNEKMFHDWFKNILPLLDDNCVIVMDNAPYHCVKMEKIPNNTWRKPDIIEWLRSKGKEVDDSMVKAELLHVVKLEKYKFDKYVIDEMAKEQNKTVLRLPPYHCELNPIEMAWSKVKEYVKTNNRSFKLPDVKRLIEEGIARETAESWNVYIRHVVEEEKKFWEIDDIADKIVDQISNVGIDVNSESDFETDDSD